MSRFVLACSLLLFWTAGAAQADGAWPSFHGPQAHGVAANDSPPVSWNLETGENVRWKTPIPGLAHASPIVWGDHVYVVTVVGELEDPELRVGLYGDVGPAKDDGVQRWWLYALSAETGEVTWKRLVHEGEPAVRRHTKATHANATPATDGERIAVFLGSQGLHVFGMDGTPLWKKDFGTLDAGFYMMPAMQWGFGNSPVFHDGKLVVLADVQKGGFLALFDAADGKELWRVPRTDVPTWSAPTVVEVDAPPAAEGATAVPATQIVVNGYKHMGAYDFATGAEVWKMANGGDIPVPTPIAGHGLVFLTNAHGRLAPVYAIRADATGDISLEDDATTSDGVVWSVLRGSGAYMQTPVLLGDELYVCRDNGVLTVFDARTGKEHYKERLTSSGDGFSASGVAAGGHLYFTSEVGDVHVLRAGTAFDRVATLELGEVAMATPAIAHDTLYFRTKGHVIAIGHRPVDAGP